MRGSMSSAQSVEPTLTIPTIHEETSQESYRNDTDGAIGSDDENIVSPPKFETNTDHGLDSFDEQYPFTEDETFYDFIGEEDNGEGVNCDSPNFKGEGDISGESTASDHSHSRCDHEDDIVGNTTTQRGSSVVSHPWSILESEQYSFYTISHESSTINCRLYKDDNCSFRVRAWKIDEGEYWQILKFYKEHSCTIKGFQGQFRQANSSVIGELVSLKLQVNGTTLKPKDIMTEMQVHYDIHIQYTKAWPMNDHPESIVFESTTESFQRIPLYLYMLERKNPNTVTGFELDGNLSSIKNWSRSYSSIRRYFMITSNVAEYINSCLRYARQFPVTVLIEYIRDMQKWFHD
ncbi:hypothetical protein Ddye_000322 [Dipteronia dyeriana]|uniref:Uncharacterized protein n=1 Tax=Dipteronia dyeriana TaxID=168575 RepID=A0AAD9XMR1_9ROSI|nr:hypothetical protein Ddye_000322 [Dipteronia dyeriana]